MRMNLTPPPGLRGDEKSQLVQMHSFLFQLTEQLNAALSQADDRLQAAERITGTGQRDEGGKKLSPTLQDQYQSLKSLIIKTAHTVKGEMDVIRARLNSDYIAVSDWGRYEENLRADFEATAGGVVESYGYASRLDSLDEHAADFDSYVAETNGYIKRGIIGYDADNAPVIGIAIGQDLKSVKVTIDGVEYEEIDTTRNLATYTSSGITFWQNGVKVAWFSNEKLACTSITVADRIIFEEQWEISRGNGFTVKWIGGDA